MFGRTVAFFPSLNLVAQITFQVPDEGEAAEAQQSAYQRERYVACCDTSDGSSRLAHALSGEFRIIADSSDQKYGDRTGDCAACTAGQTEETINRTFGTFAVVSNTTCFFCI